jgi:hypothetical protein
MTSKFTANQFTPTEWSTAEDKARFANHFLKFLDRGFPRTLFQKWFYNQLRNTFGHIAHFDIHGFWSEFFETTEGKVRFLKITVNPPLGFCGDPAYTYSDVERAISEKVKVGNYLQEWKRKLDEETETAERSQLARLKEKYEKA